MGKNSKILIVDDIAQNIQLLGNILREFGDYEVNFSTDGKHAINRALKGDIDLILLDVMMPVMDGFEICKILKADEKTKLIPVIFLTASMDTKSITKGFEVGGVDYITKPFTTIELLARVQNHLNLRDYQLHLENKIEEGIAHIKVLNKEIEDTQREVVFTMGAIGETRSKETGNHVKRVAEYSKVLALEYGLSEKEAELLREASPMHDIGKVAISDNILNKPAKLTYEEFEIMKKHSELGYQMLNKSNRPILKTASIIAYEHHEKWNGTGYPRGLSGEDINIVGRITAVADVFDALGSDRCYKKAWEMDKILDLFKSERGEHFEPKLIDIFFNNLDTFLNIKEKFKDT